MLNSEKVAHAILALSRTMIPEIAFLQRQNRDLSFCVVLCVAVALCLCGESSIRAGGPPKVISANKKPYISQPDPKFQPSVPIKPNPAPLPFMDNKVYVNYWANEWRESGRLLPADAQRFALQVRKLVAETQLVDVGVSAPGYPYPNPNLISVVKRVQFRMKTPQQLIYTNVRQATAAMLQVQKYGFDAKITQGYPMSSAPKPKPVAVKELPERFVWTGHIYQQDHTLPARIHMIRKGNKISGTLYFTFQKYDIHFRPTELRYHEALVKGHIHKNQVKFTVTRALQGRVYVGTEYVGQLSDNGSLKGQWHHWGKRVAGRFHFSLQE